MNPGERKAYLEIEEQEEPIRCMFNPAALVVSKSNSWSPAETKGTNAPKLTFDKGEPGTLSLSLVFDTTGEGVPVTDYTDRLLNLMKVNPDLPSADPSSNKGRPPWVRLHWADLHSFKAIIEQMQVSFTYFARAGTPLRAKADLGLKQYEDDEVSGLQNPTSGTPRPHRVHRLQPGESLDRVAAACYGDPFRWRLLADANQVLDPLALEPGTVLVVPERTRDRRG